VGLYTVQFTPAFPSSFASFSTSAYSKTLAAFYSSRRFIARKISMQDEITVLRLITVPSKGWKSSNIWEQI
jgi:hypothetical protein